MEPEVGGEALLCWRAHLSSAHPPPETVQEELRSGGAGQLHVQAGRRSGRVLLQAQLQVRAFTWRSAPP